MTRTIFLAGLVSASAAFATGDNGEHDELFPICLSEERLVFFQRKSVSGGTSCNRVELGYRVVEVSSMRETYEPIATATECAPAIRPTEVKLDATALPGKSLAEVLSRSKVRCSMAVTMATAIPQAYKLRLARPDPKGPIELRVDDAVRPLHKVQGLGEWASQGEYSVQLVVQVDDQRILGLRSWMSGMAPLHFVKVPAQQWVAKVVQTINDAGLVHHRAGRWAESATLFQLAADYDSAREIYRYNLACALARQGKVAEAVAQLRSCDLTPQLKNKIAKDPDFDGIRSSPELKALLAQ